MSLWLSFFINITSIIISPSKNCGGNYNEVMDIKCSEQWALNKGSPLLPGAEITKYHMVSDLNNRNVSSHSSGVWKSKMNVLAGSLPSDSLGRICPISVQLLVVCQKSLPASDVRWPFSPLCLFYVSSVSSVSLYPNLFLFSVTKIPVIAFKAHPIPGWPHLNLITFARILFPVMVTFTASGE